MAVGYDYELYVDGARVFYDDVRFNIQITDTQFVEMSGSSTGSYSYDEGQYLGWTTTQGGTTPTYEVGDIFQVNGQVYLFSIPASSPTGKTQLGTRPITKKMFGTREITKEVVNGVVVYEKQASTFNVDITLNNTGDLTWGNVYIYDGQDSTGTLLYSLEKNIPATISTSVQCSTGYLCIRGTASGDPQDSIALNTSLSNNVAVIYEAEGSTFDGKYQIIGNATLVANCHYAY